MALRANFQTGGLKHSINKPSQNTPKLTLNQNTNSNKNLINAEFKYAPEVEIVDIGVGEKTNTPASADDDFFENGVKQVEELKKSAKKPKEEKKKKNWFEQRIDDIGNFASDAYDGVTGAIDDGANYAKKKLDAAVDCVGSKATAFKDTVCEYAGYVPGFFTSDEFLDSFSSISNVAISAGIGIADGCEHVLDLSANLGTAILSVPTGIYDGGQAIYGAITGNEWESATKKMWGNTQDFVKEDLSGDLKDWYYDGYGASLNEYASVKSDSTACQITEGVTSNLTTLAFGNEIFGLFGEAAQSSEVVANILSKVSNTKVGEQVLSLGSKVVTQKSAVQGLFGFERGTEEAWQHGKGVLAGFGEGTIRGTWDMATGRFDEIVGDLPLKGTQGIDTIKNVLRKSGADVSAGVIDGYVQVGMDALFNGKSLSQAYEDAGGVNGILEQIAVNTAISTAMDKSLGLLEKNNVNKLSTSNVSDVDIEQEIYRLQRELNTDIDEYNKLIQIKQSSDYKKYLEDTKHGYATLLAKDGVDFDKLEGRLLELESGISEKNIKLNEYVEIDEKHHFLEQTQEIPTDEIQHKLDETQEIPTDEIQRKLDETQEIPVDEIQHKLDETQEIPVDEINESLKLGDNIHSSIGNSETEIKINELRSSIYNHQTEYEKLVSIKKSQEYLDYKNGLSKVSSLDGVDFDKLESDLLVMQTYIIFDRKELENLIVQKQGEMVKIYENNILNISEESLNEDIGKLKQLINNEEIDTEITLSKKIDILEKYIDMCKRKNIDCSEFIANLEYQKMKYYRDYELPEKLKREFGDYTKDHKDAASVCVFLDESDFKLLKNSDSSGGYNNGLVSFIPYNMENSTISPQHTAAHETLHQLSAGGGKTTGFYTSESTRGINEAATELLAKKIEPNGSTGYDTAVDMLEQLIDSDCISYDLFKKAYFSNNLDLIGSELNKIANYDVMNELIPLFDDVAHRRSIKSKIELQETINSLIKLKLSKQ